MFTIPPSLFNAEVFPSLAAHIRPTDSLQAVYKTLVRYIMDYSNPESINQNALLAIPRYLSSQQAARVLALPNKYISHSPLLWPFIYDTWNVRGFERLRPIPRSVYDLQQFTSASQIIGSHANLLEYAERSLSESSTQTNPSAPSPSSSRPSSSPASTLSSPPLSSSRAVAPRRRAPLAPLKEEQAEPPVAHDGWEEGEVKEDAATSAADAVPSQEADTVEMEQDPPSSPSAAAASSEQSEFDRILRGE